MTTTMRHERTTGANRRLAKKRVQWLNEALCFVSSLVLKESLVLRNPLHHKVPKRYDYKYKNPVSSSNE